MKPQANDGDRSLPTDTFDHVFNLVQNGNRAFRENRYEEVEFQQLKIYSTVGVFSVLIVLQLDVTYMKNLQNSCQSIQDFGGNYGVIVVEIFFLMYSLVFKVTNT